MSSIITTNRVAYSAPAYDVDNHGADYAFMSLMTLSPDFAAANYTIHNPDSADVDISIGRLPFLIPLAENERSKWQLELALGYQRTKQTVSTSTIETGDEYVDSEWDTFGAGLGLLYDFNLTNQWLLTPSFRFGVAHMTNHADYYGDQTIAIKDILDSLFFNWNTNTGILNIGVGLNYNWKLLDRPSRINAGVYHIVVSSFNESNPTIEFNETANMLTLNADMVFPTNTYFSKNRLDFVLLLGANNYFGSNRRTLGYTTSYQAGLGVELPLKLSGKTYGYFRCSGQALAAENMRGWLLTFGYRSM